MNLHYLLLLFLAVLIISTVITYRQIEEFGFDQQSNYWIDILPNDEYRVSSSEGVLYETKGKIPFDFVLMPQYNNKNVKIPIKVKKEYDGRFHYYTIDYNGEIAKVTYQNRTHFGQLELKNKENIKVTQDDDTMLYKLQNSDIVHIKKREARKYHAVIIENESTYWPFFLTSFIIFHSLRLND